jgi:hypothetical protein
MGRVISASFVWNEQDYVAAYRAARMVRDSGYDSLVMRAGFLLLTHLFVLGGLLVVGLALAGAEGKEGPIPLSAVAINTAVALAAGYALFTRWYGFRWMMRRAYRSSPLYDLKVNYLFTPQQVEYTSRLAQSRRDWSLINQVVEFRDGFLLVSGATAEWVPRYAFTEPFDDVAFSELARSYAKRYKSIERTAALSKSAPGGFKPARRSESDGLKGASGKMADVG